MANYNDLSVTMTKVFVILFKRNNHRLYLNQIYIISLSKIHDQYQINQICNSSNINIPSVGGTVEGFVGGCVVG